MADEDKLVKAGVEAALKPFADLLEKLAGPAAEEIGLTIQDHFRAFRTKRQIRLFERTKEMLEEAGVDAQKVPLKLLKPLIESGSLEDNDSLQDRWAALLANAANVSSNIHPAFPEILKQLDTTEVTYMDVLYEFYRDDHIAKMARRSNAIFSEVTAERLRKIRPEMSREELLAEVGLTIAGQNMTRLGLIVQPEALPNYISPLGRAFVRACRTPGTEEIKRR
jgi:hypothetical protein